MTKYHSCLKREVVDACLQGNHLPGCEAAVIAKCYGIDVRLVRHWVLLFQQHGQPGLDPKYSHYNAQFKLQVLQHLWREALPATEIAALYGIRNRAAVSCWDRQYHEGGIEALEPRRRGRAPKMTPSESPKPTTKPDQERTLDELRQEVEYLRAEVAYLKKWNALVQAKKAAAQTKRG
jgi:transposase